MEALVIRMDCLGDMRRSEGQLYISVIFGQKVNSRFSRQNYYTAPVSQAVNLPVPGCLDSIPVCDSAVGNVKAAPCITFVRGTKKRILLAERGGRTPNLVISY